MGAFLPVDVSGRISRFISKDLDFPFIKKDEVMGIFFLFGKNNGINGPLEIMTATDLAKRTIGQLGRDISLNHNMPSKLSSDFVRETYTQRALQISIESGQNITPVDSNELRKRISGDPTILCSCFVQHIAFYRNNYFFKLFQPLKENQIPSSMKRVLSERMLLLGFNVADAACLPFDNLLSPFISWLRRSGVSYF
jgi:hypothetical protein